jgi:hypothetical protein
MSYTHLAGRLIEVQRSMLGQPAITIAQSIDGLRVSPDGNVTAIDSDKGEVIATLFDRYTDILGDPAENRLRTAAIEFEDELALPPNLASTTEDTDEPTDFKSDTDAPSQDLSASETEPDDRIDDATSIEIQSPGDQESTNSTLKAKTDAGTRRTAVRKEYTIQNGSEPAAGDHSDLTSVYLLREESGWQVPISVEEAITDAVAEEAGLGDDELGQVGDYTEAGEILSVLGSETETVASFEVGHAIVVVHPSGTIAVQQK